MSLFASLPLVGGVEENFIYLFLIIFCYILGMGLGSPYVGEIAKNVWSTFSYYFFNIRCCFLYMPCHFCASPFIIFLLSPLASFCDAH
jgi:hypothetical protein